MIMLNQPYSFYERRFESARRREAARRALIVVLYTAAGFALGIGTGCLTRFLAQ